MNFISRYFGQARRQFGNSPLMDPQAFQTRKSGKFSSEDDIFAQHIAKEWYDRREDDIFAQHIAKEWSD
jgi:hypothetical protein